MSSVHKLVLFFPKRKKICPKSCLLFPKSCLHFTDPFSFPKLFLLFPRSSSPLKSHLSNRLLGFWRRAVGLPQIWLSLLPVQSSPSPFKVSATASLIFECYMSLQIVRKYDEIENSVLDFLLMVWKQIVMKLKTGHVPAKSEQSLEVYPWSFCSAQFYFQGLTLFQ